MVRPPNSTNPLFLAFLTGVTVVLLTALPGCKVGPDYVPPQTEMPDKWTEEAVAGLEDGTAEMHTWWKQFNDPLLDELIAKAKELLN